jgi:hypothetical protein
MLIAWVILECEHESRNGKNLNRRPQLAASPSDKPSDDWCRYILHQLTIHCKESTDLLNNHVSFVTFNYDVSLEKTLGSGLKHIQMFAEKDVTQFLGGSRVVHIYGKIRDEAATAIQLDWKLQNLDLKQLTELSMGDYHTKMKAFLEVIYRASKGLRVIDPHDKGVDDTEILIARRAIANAKRVFILGYGFDEHNSARLNLREHLANTQSGYQLVAFTNYQDINQINKRASKLFYDHPRYFPSGRNALSDRYEKSIRNTYDALAMDFDLAE